MDLFINAMARPAVNYVPNMVAEPSSVPTGSGDDANRGADAPVLPTTTVGAMDMPNVPVSGTNYVSAEQTFLAAEPNLMAAQFGSPPSDGSSELGSSPEQPSHSELNAQVKALMATVDAQKLEMEKRMKEFGKKRII